MDLNLFKIGVTENGNLILYRAHKNEPTKFTEFRNVEPDIFVALTEFISYNNPEELTHRFKVGEHTFEIALKLLKEEEQDVQRKETDENNHT